MSLRVDSPSVMPSLTLFAVPVAVSTTLGALCGLRGRSLSSIGASARTGAISGAVFGAVLVAADVISGGGVRREIPNAHLNSPHQWLFAVKNMNRPYLGLVALDAAAAAESAQHRIFGEFNPLDGQPDAFRHAFASATLSLRLMRDHGVDEATAKRLTEEAGAAHEADGQDNNTPFAHQMDEFNNRVGADLAGDGHSPDGGWMDNDDLTQRVLEALHDGDLMTAP